MLVVAWTRSLRPGLYASITVDPVRKLRVQATGCFISQ